MKKLYITTLVLFTLLLVSCKQESLQSYLVNSQEKKGFSHITIPSSILQIGTISLSEEEKKAYKSVHKINVTGLLASNAEAGQYETEKEKLKTILKNSDYKKLMNFKKSGAHITLYYTGDADAIDEFIAFGYGEDFGVGVARILGDNMNMNAIVKMLNKTKLDSDNVNLGQIKGLFENLVKSE